MQLLWLLLIQYTKNYAKSEKQIILWKLYQTTYILIFLYELMFYYQFYSHMFIL